MNKLVY